MSLPAVSEDCNTCTSYLLFGSNLLLDERNGRLSYKKIMIVFAGAMLELVACVTTFMCCTNQRFKGISSLSPVLFSGSLSASCCVLSQAMLCYLKTHRYHPVSGSNAGSSFSSSSSSSSSSSPSARFSCLVRKVDATIKLVEKSFAIASLVSTYLDKSCASLVLQYVDDQERLFQNLENVNVRFLNHLDEEGRNILEKRIKALKAFQPWTMDYGKEKAVRAVILYSNSLENEDQILNNMYINSCLKEKIKFVFEVIVYRGVDCAIYFIRDIFENYYEQLDDPSYWEEKALIEEVVKVFFRQLHPVARIRMEDVFENFMNHWKNDKNKNWNVNEKTAEFLRSFLEDILLAYKKYNPVISNLLGLKEVYEKNVPSDVHKMVSASDQEGLKLVFDMYYEQCENNFPKKVRFIHCLLEATSDLCSIEKYLKYILKKEYKKLDAPVFLDQKKLIIDIIEHLFWQIIPDDKSWTMLIKIRKVIYSLGTNAECLKETFERILSARENAQEKALLASLAQEMSVEEE